MNALLIVLTLRIFLPLIILVHPLSGAIFSMLADFYDFGFFEQLGWGGINFPQYQKMDKIFDAYYLSVEFYVTRKWKDKFAKNLAAWLFAWRILGVAVFVSTGFREALFFGPNIFEFFFIFYLATKKLYPSFKIKNNITFIAAIVILGVLKILHEYFLHVGSLGKILNFLLSNLDIRS